MPLTLLTVAAALVLVAVPAPARAAATQPAAGATSDAGPAPGKSKGKKGSTKGKGKTSPRRTKGRGHTAGAGKAADPHKISEGTPRITAFPSESGAVDKAFAENRRDQIGDAEKAARAAKQDDRWHTVLFHIRELDSRNDPEACFWRVLAYYRLGEIGRARTMRQTCELPNRDNQALNTEDAAAAMLQPTAGLGELRAAGELDPDGQHRPEHPVGNDGPYAGPAPTRFK